MLPNSSFTGNNGLIAITLTLSVNFGLDTITPPLGHPPVILVKYFSWYVPLTRNKNQSLQMYTSNLCHAVYFLCSVVKAYLGLWFLSPMVSLHELWREEQVTRWGKSHLFPLEYKNIRIKVYNFQNIKIHELFNICRYLNTFDEVKKWKSLHDKKAGHYPQVYANHKNRSVVQF